jgi:TonB family protein
LVIRVKLPSREPTQPEAQRRLGRNTLLLILATVVVALIWLGIHTFGSDPIVSSAVTESASARTAESSVPRTEDPSPKPAAEPAETSPVKDEGISVINEVVPEVPRSALQTIRGTIRVSVRVNVDKQGKVVGTAVDEHGPSRYFERLAVDAASKWSFTPAKSEERRMMLVKISFTRAGATARASPMQ